MKAFLILCFLMFQKSETDEKKIENCITKSINEKELVEISLTFAKKFPKIFIHFPNVNPLYPGQKYKIASGVSSKRLHPIYKKYKAHNGLDISSKKNSPIYATADGVVSKAAFFNGSAGHSVRLIHKYGFVTQYFHLSMIAVENKEKVVKGQIIGFLGNTGSSTSAHLHYEIWKNNKVLNPIYFLKNKN